MKVILIGRDTATGSAGLSCYMKLNNDGTSGNYTTTQILSASGGTTTATTLAATANGADCANIPGSSGNANAVGFAEINIASYAATVFQKIVTSIFGNYQSGPASATGTRTFIWKSTAAITQIDITAGGTAFVDGTTATLYGIN